MKKVYKGIRKIITPNFIKIIILLIPIILLLIYKYQKNELYLESFLSISTFCAITIAFICEFIAEFIISFFESKFEDSLKLTDNYQDLIKKYRRVKLFEYKGEIFPTICLQSRKYSDAPFHFVFDHSRFKHKYELPSQIAANSDYLMKAHSHSHIYNQLTIRLDNIEQMNGDTIISYSQTSYFDSLITNRSIDYCWENGKSIREIYEPGPFISSLKKSKLSNHIGFHCFLETNDGKIILVKRKENVSVGKRTWGASVGASLKAMYALDDNQQLTFKGISNAIKMEIFDELYINVGDSVDLSQCIFAFYRDLVEGGKPHFLVFYKLDNYSFEDFKSNFNTKYMKQNNIVDGIEFIGISLYECLNCVITNKGFKYSNRFINMTASTASSFAMLLEYLGEKES